MAMDILAHTLWAYGIARIAKLKQRWLILGIIGAGPDFIWLPFTAFDFVMGHSLRFHYRPYEISHSLVLWLLLTLISSIRWRKAITWTWPWALHILIDIPGHIDMPTPFLWPVSHFTFRGVFDWLSPKLLLINYSVLAIIFIFLWQRDRRRLRQQHITSQS